VLSPRPENRNLPGRLGWYLMSAAASIAAVGFVVWTASPGWRAEPQLAGGSAATTTAPPVATLVSAVPPPKSRTTCSPIGLIPIRVPCKVSVPTCAVRLTSVGHKEMTLPFALRVWQPARILPFLIPVSAAIAQTDPSALQWLQRIYAATERLSYSGTFVYQQGQQVETSRIAHAVEASVARERLETLDGVPREIIRTGDEVVCYLPASLTVRIDKQPGRRPFPAILSEQLKDVSENYTVRKGEIERVAGYSCQVLALEPKTGCDTVTGSGRISIPVCCSKQKPSMKRTSCWSSSRSRSSRSAAHRPRSTEGALSPPKPGLARRGLGRHPRQPGRSWMGDPCQACGLSHRGRADSQHGRHCGGRPYSAVGRARSDLRIHRACV